MSKRKRLYGREKRIKEWRRHGGPHASTRQKNSHCIEVSCYAAIEEQLGNYRRPAGKPNHKPRHKPVLAVVRVVVVPDEFTMKHVEPLPVDVWERRVREINALKASIE
jgi:hypothetical protein